MSKEKKIREPRVKSRKKNASFWSFVKYKVRTSLPEDRKMYAYPFRTFARPFDTFSDIKYENKGSVLISLIVLFFYFLAGVAEYLYTGFLFNNNDVTQFNIFSQMFFSVVLVLLWCVSNWAICTLMDGEGTFKMIWIATCYSLVPMIFGKLIKTLLSNVLIFQEQTFLQLFDTVGIVFFCFFLFVGMLTIHQYSVTKTVVSCLFTVAGILLIIFLFILLFSIAQQMYGFFQTVLIEFLSKT